MRSSDLRDSDAVQPLLSGRAAEEALLRLAATLVGRTLLFTSADTVVFGPDGPFMVVGVRPDEAPPEPSDRYPFVVLELLDAEGKSDYVLFGDTDLRLLCTSGSVSLHHGLARWEVQS